jgi:hypothetical protein
MFMPIDRADTARDRLAVARQREKDSVAAYTTYMRQLFLAIPGISEDEKIDRYKRGLLSHLQKEVILKKPSTLEEAIIIATRYDALRHTLGKGNYERERHFKGPSTHRSAEHRKDDPMELGAMGLQKGKQPSRKPGLKKKGKCWNCDEEGHFANECPHPRKPENKKKGPNRKNGPWRRPSAPQGE